MKRWLTDRAGDHFARKALAVGTWTLRTKLIVGVLAVYLVIILIATIIGAIVAPVGSALDAAARFLGVSSFTHDGQSSAAPSTPTDESPDTSSALSTCMNNNRVDPSFTTLVDSVPARTPLDQATGWLIYAAPHQTTDRPATTTRRPATSGSTRGTLTLDQFLAAWQRATSYSSTTQQQPRPDSVLDVVEAIDPTTNYSDYTAQAYIGAIYLLATGVAYTSEDETGSLVSGLVSFCRGDTDVLPQPQLSH